MSLKPQVVSVEKAYNLGIFEQYFFIDTRAESSYHASHILYARSCPSFDISLLNRAQQMEKVLEFFSKYQTTIGGPERYSPMVLYGDDSQGFVIWLANIICQVLNTPELVPDFLKIYQKRTHQVWVIEGGFPAWLNRFSFACGPKGEDIPYPFYILDNVFLGARSFPLDERSLKAMGITHLAIDCDTDQYVQLNMGLTLMKVDVPDRNYARMEETWRAVAGFIELALHQNPNHIVLVQVHGRARSASFIMAWLILHRGFSVEAALELIQERFSNIDTSLMYLEQLLELKPCIAIQN
jgi:hypothetical protein